MIGERQERLAETSRYDRLKDRINGALRVDESSKHYWVCEYMKPAKSIKLALGMSAWSFALGFPRYFNRTVLFPAFPNELDSAGWR